jgi:predicted GH43/DUF377 family glycosyl hydrolase
MKWKKLGKLFDPTTVPDKEWMKEFAQCTSTLILEDRVRIYFSCRPYKDQDGQAKSYTAFIDVDKNNLFNIINIAEEPVLPLGGLGTFDEFAVYPTSVIKHYDEVRLYYAGWTRMKSVPFNTAIGVATSNNNGITFERIGTGPILSASVDEPFVLSGPKVRQYDGMWYMFYLAGSKWIMNENKPEIVYKIRMAISKDGYSWNKINKNIIKDILEPDECQAGPDVFYKDGKYHMYFVYRYALDFRNNRDRGYRIGYAYSHNLIDWTRDDKNVGIHYSESGEWDGDMHHYPHIFELDGNHYMLYNGNEFGKYGFGLAILEDDSKL